MNKFTSAQHQIREISDRLGRIDQGVPYALFSDQELISLMEDYDFNNNNNNNNALQEVSTLSTLVGDSPGGRDLLKFIHKYFKLSPTAHWDEITQKDTERVQLEMFKKYPHSVLVVMGSQAVMALKPAHRRGTDPYKNLETGKKNDSTRPYYIVGFKITQESSKPGEKGPGKISLQSRIDNLFAVPPEPPKKSDGAGAFDEYQQDYAEYERRRKEGGADQEEPTLMKLPRGGHPYKKDPGARNPSFFDRVRELIGNVNGIYVSTTRHELPRGDSASKFVRKFKAGVVPKQNIVDPERQGSHHGAISGEKLIARRGQYKLPVDKASLLGPDVPDTIDAGDGKDAYNVYGKGATGREIDPSIIGRLANIRANVSGTSMNSVLARMLKQADAEIADEMNRYDQDNGNMDAVARLSGVRKMIGAASAALNTDKTPNWQSSALKPIVDIISKSIDNVIQRLPVRDEEHPERLTPGEYMSMLKFRPALLGPLIKEIKRNIKEFIHKD